MTSTITQAARPPAAASLRRRHKLAAGALLAAGVALPCFPAKADPLAEPPVFASANHQLSLLMVAAAHPVTLAGVTTTAWPYEVCYRPANNPDGSAPNSCNGTGVSPLGGVRLALQAGDTLRIRLVNNLPPALDAKHALDENPDLINNPTNIHTHGLIVEPHRAEGPNDTYGDYVFVIANNPDNPALTGTANHPAGAGSHVHPDLDYVDRAIEYKIDIGANHPSGIYWFHPHMHGVALNQVSAGMSGIITVGAPTDACADAACQQAIQNGGVRHLVLKDEQVQADGTLLTQEDAAFCDGQPDPGEPARQGVCAGVVTDDGDHTGGHWFNTVNGQVYPDIKVGPFGDLWRVVNASGSRSYDLSLVDDESGKPIPLQVIAIDGVTLDARQSANLAALKDLVGKKITPEPCPGTMNLMAQEQAICTRHVRMMPSSRVEVRALRWDYGQKVRMATLHTDDYFTGGDDWPAIDLAHVALAPRDPQAVTSIATGGEGWAAFSSTGSLQGPTELQVPGMAHPMSLAAARSMAGKPWGGPVIQMGLHQAPSIAIDPALKLGLRSDPACQPLAPGHRRRVFFGNPTPGQDGFGLGYVEIDEKGNEIEATRKPITVFDPFTTTVCVPLAPGGGATSEVWELLNITDEDHNFHIHQTRFHVLAGGTVPGTVIPNNVDDALVLHDNLPLPHPDVTDNCDGSVEAFHSGACKPKIAVVRIPFREVGDFVFHCHILEHEDGGMMARIRVVAAPGT